MRRSLVAALVLITAACSHSSTPTPVASPSELQRAVSTYTAAFGRGDGSAAWGQVSDHCRRLTNETDYRATVAVAGVKYAGLHVVSYSGQVDGTGAIVIYSTSADGVGPYRGQPWVFEHGAWRFDGC
jgi:hypothetical protein